MPEQHQIQYIFMRILQFDMKYDIRMLIFISTSKKHPYFQQLSTTPERILLHCYGVQSEFFTLVPISASTSYHILNIRKNIHCTRVRVRQCVVYVCSVCGFECEWHWHIFFSGKSKNIFSLFWIHHLSYNWTFSAAKEMAIRARDKYDSYYKYIDFMQV